mmetsp:Transcript_25562/g.78631  ORF Transcript_25562/g.78631 Transcript_25562/m.78631 type:complete len:208 (+) Transcript_25562:50-673(+)
MASSRLLLRCREALDAESKTIYDRICEVWGRVGSEAKVSMTNADGSLAGPWNAAVTATPDIGSTFERAAIACRHSNSVPLELLETGILTVAASKKCDFMWYAHAELSKKTPGIALETIDAIKHLPSTLPPPASDAQRALYAYTRELDATHRVSDDTHGAALLSLHNDQRALADFVFTIGLYSQITFVLNAFPVQLPTGVPRPFPDEV